MKKIVKKFGNSLVVVIDVEEAKIYNIKEGDIIDINLDKKGVKNNDS